jgi:predicted SAM-dependent methyltransferase
MSLPLTLKGLLRQTPAALPLKLNLGCGPNGQFAGYINLDNSPSIWLSRIPLMRRTLHRLGVLTAQQLKDDWKGVVKCDAGRHLPFKDGSVDRIYSSHFLEHIPYAKALRVLRECHRTLKPGGLMRLVVPDLLWHAEKYVSQTRRLLDGPLTADSRRVHDEFLETIYGAYLHCRRSGALHCYMYDFPTLQEILTKVGFLRIKRFAFRQGDDPELASHDSRPDDSLHLEFGK